MTKRENMGESRTIRGVDWTHLISEEDWNEYLLILAEAADRGLHLALAGGLAFSEYSGRLRNTKDLDVIVQPDGAPPLIEILDINGWQDHYDDDPYDRSWIYRSRKGSLICDAIWSLPNHRFDVDSEWVAHGKEVEVYGHWTRLIGLEHLIVAKLYVFQRDRCDWPDLLNVLDYSTSRVDWNYLLKLVGRDGFLLGSLLNVFKWLAPAKAQTIPEFVWESVGLKSEGAAEPLPGESRAFLLDTRDWFGSNSGETNIADWRHESPRQGRHR